MAARVRGITGCASLRRRSQIPIALVRFCTDADAADRRGFMNHSRRFRNGPGISVPAVSPIPVLLFRFICSLLSIISWGDYGKISERTKALFSWNPLQTEGTCFDPLRSVSIPSKCARESIRGREAFVSPKEFALTKGSLFGLEKFFSAARKLAGGGQFILIQHDRNARVNFLKYVRQHRGSW